MTDIFAPFTFDQSWYEPQTIATEPLPPLEIGQKRDSITQRIADSLAGDRYYGVTPEDKDRALSMAMMEMGGRLGAAAGAGSWTKAYPFLNQMMSSGYGAYNESLLTDEKHRMAIKDRVDQLKLREMQMKKAEYDSEEVDRSEAAKESMRASAEENAAKWRSLFSETVLDTDITDPERKVFNTNFEFAMQDYLARPDDPNTINRVLDYVNKVGTAAGQTEKIDQTVANELHSQWMKEAPGIPFDKWLEDQREIYGLSLTKAQQDIALTNARIAEANAGANAQNAAAEWNRSGRPSGSGTGSITDSRQYGVVIDGLKALSGNEQLGYTLREMIKPGMTKEGIADLLKEDPATFSSIKSFLPHNEKGQVIITPESVQMVYQSIFDPIAREQFAYNYAKQGGGQAPTLQNIKVAGVDSVSDPKNAVRTQKFLETLVARGAKTVDGKPIDRASALAKLRSMTPDQIARLDKELGL